MTQQPSSPAPTAPGGGRVNFCNISWWRSRSQWAASTAAGDILLPSLAGRQVNIADKDGGVYEGVTVIAVDERTGDLTVTGGGFGVAFRDAEAAPFEGTRTISPHDIARGFIHPQSPGEGPCQR